MARQRNNKPRVYLQNDVAKLSILAQLGEALQRARIVFDIRNEHGRRHDGLVIRAFVVFRRVLVLFRVMTGAVLLLSAISVKTTAGHVDR